MMKRIISIVACLIIIISFAPNNYVQAKPKSLPKKLKMSYSSGMGAWSTSITVNKKGSFSGSYHDSEGGVTYYSSFEGKFTKIKKVASKKYTMKLTNLKFAKDSSKRFIKDPPGVKKGKVYTLYCPGYNTSKLPDEVKRWFKMIRRGYERDGKLTKYILCNTKEYIFFFD